MDTLAIVKRIEMKLSEIGMTKAEFYKQSNISSASFSQWRTGKYKPSEKNLAKAAAALGLSYSYLVNGVDDKKAPTPKGERLGDRNVIRILGRDGSAVTKILTDEQLRAFLTMVDHLPEADDL